MSQSQKVEVRKDPNSGGTEGDIVAQTTACLLYTSDAADERSSVDLGGRRIIKKKNMMNICSAKDNNTRTHVSRDYSRYITIHTTKTRHN